MKLSETFREEIKKNILMGKTEEDYINSDSGEEEINYYFDEDVAVYNVCELIERDIEAIDRGAILEEMKELLKQYIQFASKNPEHNPEFIKKAMDWFDSKYKL